MPGRWRQPGLFALQQSLSQEYSFSHNNGKYYSNNIKTSSPRIDILTPALREIRLLKLYCLARNPTNRPIARSLILQAIYQASVWQKFSLISWGDQCPVTIFKTVSVWLYDLLKESAMMVLDFIVGYLKDYQHYLTMRKWKLLTALQLTGKLKKKMVAQIFNKKVLARPATKCPTDWNIK